MPEALENTVAAISTPYGRGGIALIRISGSYATQIAGAVFCRADGRPFSSGESGMAHYGSIVNPDGEVIDDGLAVIFRAPASFTGEDTVEISCHGGILVSGEVLRAVFEAGAAPAGPGEFTKRAFMNGKISLSQAESVIDVIDAETTSALRLARANASGALSKRIDGIYKELESIAAETYVYLDYPDEDLADMTPGRMKEKLQEIFESLLGLYNSYRAGHAIGEGIYTVITGKPNSGKSSLLNRMLGKERAIVSDIAGTTRDFIEESVPVGNILLRLCDTAGIREDGGDLIEKTGIERSFEALERAELVLAVFDGSSAQSGEDTVILERLSENPASKIALINKCDLERKFDAKLTGFDRVISISAKTGEGIDSLNKCIEELFIGQKIDYGNYPLISNARQAANVKKALNAVSNALSALSNGLSPDMAGLDIEEAMGALGECDGRTVGADIVNNIFHRFCVGK